MVAPSFLQPLPQATVRAHGPSLLGHPSPSSSACSLQSDFHLSLLLHHPPTTLPHPIHRAGSDLSQG